MKEGKWLVLESDHYVIVFPNNEPKPHGKRISDTEYNLDTLECTCGATLQTGEVSKVDDMILENYYKKPIVIHNSFPV